MQLKLQRKTTTSISTTGVLTMADGKTFYTLEDTFHEKKIYGETRISAGTYSLSIANWGKAVRYNAAYKDINHRGMIMLDDVQGFTGVLIHTGNTKEDTLGCILIGRTLAKDFIGETREAYREFYPIVTAALESGEEVKLTISDS